MQDLLKWIVLGSYIFNVYKKYLFIANHQIKISSVSMRTHNLIVLMLHVLLVIGSQSDDSESDSGISDDSFVANLSNCEPVVLTGSSVERFALVDQIYDIEVQTALLNDARQAVSICGTTYNTTISTHFEGGNFVTFVIEVNNQDEELFNLASCCIMRNFSGGFSIKSKAEALEEVSEEENIRIVRKLLWYLDMAELKSLAEKRS